MKPRPAINIFLVFLCSVQLIKAQSFSAVPASLSFQNFTYENGLSDNAVTHISQDSRGFIWISTPEGLNRFDGNDFRKFHPAKGTKGIQPFNKVKIIREYRKNRLLVLNDKGLISLNAVDKQFEPAGTNLLDSAVIFSMVVESSNRIWIGTLDCLILADSMLRVKKIFRNNPEVYRDLLSMHRLNDGRIVITCLKGSFFLNGENGSLSLLQQEFKEIPELKELLFSYYNESTNSLYYWEWGKPVLRIDLTNKKVTRFPVFGIVQSICRDSRGYTWLGTTEGLVLFNELTGKYTRYRHQPAEKNSLVDDAVTYLFEDREKNIWIGTREGLSKLSNRSLSLTYFENELAINGKTAEIYDINKGQDGKIYVASFGNGVFSIDSFGRLRNYGRDMIAYTWSLRPKGNTMIVTGHGKGIFELDLLTGKEKLLPILSPFKDTGNLVVFSYQDRRAGEWYSINNQMGLFYKKPGAADFIHYSSKADPPDFEHSYFSMAAEDNRNRIWFAMNKRSDFVSYNFITGQFATHQLSKATGAHLGGINCLLGEDSVIWIGTNGTGLIRYEHDAGQATLYNTDNGLSSNSITSLVFDRSHRLWVGTSRGLSCLSPGENRFINFSRSDGFREINFGEGTIYYDSVRNKLYAGAKSTLVCFDPDEFLRSSLPSKPLYLDEVRVNGSPITFGSTEKLKLRYHQNNFQFHFTAVDFENSKNTQYAYMLEGADKDWIESGTQRMASYSNLPHGRYTFLIKADQPGHQTLFETSLPFEMTITPPYWKTWWFRNLIIIGLIGLLYALIRAYYLRKLEHQRLSFEKQQAIEQERTRIATDMHDDLGAGLSRIKFLSQTLSKKKTEDEMLRSGLEKITDYSDEMSEKMGEIVWALNQKNDTLADLVAYTRAYVVEYLGNHQLNCEINTPMQLPGTFIPSEIRRNIFLSVKECLHNIIKHAEATNVFFSVELNGQIEITIHDNGKGIDWENQRTFSNGLQNIRKRMNDIKGKAEFQTQNGTKVLLKAPLSL